jgi:hypothetical protein
MLYGVVTVVAKPATDDTEMVPEYVPGLVWVAMQPFAFGVKVTTPPTVARDGKLAGGPTLNPPPPAVPVSVNGVHASQPPLVAVGPTTTTFVLRVAPVVATVTVGLGPPPNVRPVPTSVENVRLVDGTGVAYVVVAL